MKVNNTHYKAIWYDRDDRFVKIIDQTKLPFSFEIKVLNNTEDFYNAIKKMEVRGAPLIGATAAYAMYIACIESARQKNPEKYLLKVADYIKSSRPTAVNLFYAVDFMLKRILVGEGAEKRIEVALKLAESYAEKDIQDCMNIGKYGLKIIEDIARQKRDQVVNILTHCNAGWLACGDYGTATAPVYYAYDKGIKVHVWVDETRPRNQGAKLTAWELGQHGVDHTIIADNTGGHLMQHGLVDLVIVGSDRTTRAGDVANKIGTYLKALAAYDNNVPFYVALPSSTIDWDISDGIREIPIEERNADEINYMDGLLNGKVTTVRISPENSKAVNYGFDVTPAKYVTGLVTEKGICTANKEGIQSIFPDKIT